MRYLTRTLLVPAAAGLLLSPLDAVREPADRPNVVVVFLDDAGYGDFAHTGNPTIETPNLTRLAREGATFTQFYVTSPACSASRYSLLTGRTPGRSGLGRWVVGPQAERHLHPDEITIADGLRTAGYATGIFGKWHLGTPNERNAQTPDALPLAHGFDTWVGTDVSHDYDRSRLIESSPDGETPIRGYELIAEGLPDRPEIGATLTSLYTERAVAFIRENRDEPFFLYLPHNMPHLGLYVADAFRGTSRRGLLGDVMAEIDDSLGRIVAELERLGIAKNTMVVVTSDNGPWIRFRDTEDHPKYGEARLHVGYAMPFRDGKGSTWEGGVRVPGVFWWPGMIEPETVELAPVSTLDILPTVFHLAEVPLPGDRVIDGRNIAPYLNRDRFGGEVGEFRFPYSGPDNTAFAFREGPWKLHIRLTSQLGTDHGFSASRESPLLFQVEQDLGERIDRSGERPEVTAALLRSLGEYERSLEDDPGFWDE